MFHKILRWASFFILPEFVNDLGSLESRRNHDRPNSRNRERLSDYFQKLGKRLKCKLNSKILL